MAIGANAIMDGKWAVSATAKSSQWLMLWTVLAVWRVTGKMAFVITTHQAIVRPPVTISTVSAILSKHLRTQKIHARTLLDDIMAVYRLVTISRHIVRITVRTVSVTPTLHLYFHRELVKSSMDIMPLDIMQADIAPVHATTHRITVCTWHPTGSAMLTNPARTITARVIPLMDFTTNQQALVTTINSPAITVTSTMDSVTLQCHRVTRRTLAFL
jgi:hypothetical protein